MCTFFVLMRKRTIDNKRFDGNLIPRIREILQKGRDMAGFSCITEKDVIHIKTDKVVHLEI